MNFYRKWLDSLGSPDTAAEAWTAIRTAFREARESRGQAWDNGRDTLAYLGMIECPYRDVHAVAEAMRDVDYHNMSIGTSACFAGLSSNYGYDVSVPGGDRIMVVPALGLEHPCSVFLRFIRLFWRRNQLMESARGLVSLLGQLREGQANLGCLGHPRGDWLYRLSDGRSMDLSSDLSLFVSSEHPYGAGWEWGYERAAILERWYSFSYLCGDRTTRSSDWSRQIGSTYNRFELVDVLRKLQDVRPVYAMAANRLAEGTGSSGITMM